MEIELNPNCSEATVRIDISKLTEEEKDKLLKAVEKFDSEKNPECYDTHVYFDEIFGLKTLEISGNEPYNNYSEIEEAISETGLDEKIRIDFREG